ncbi:MAG: hypothetical protein GY790_16080 [Bacteroidetes bacterium]|nr:hypothetical protein [Bacteroidota bacterium]
MKQLNKNIPVIIVMLLLASCMPPQEEKEVSTAVKHNCIILLDLSDRLIVQDNQPERDKELIKHIYTIFEERVRSQLYLRSRDEIRVVIAPQRGADLKSEVYEDSLYINIENIPGVLRRKTEDERRSIFSDNLDKLYDQAVFSDNPKDFYGADIWRYFYEDLKVDYVSDTLTQNFLFLLTDGYPIVGKDLSKLQTVKEDYPDLKIILIEAAPRDKDLEWDRVIELWEEWFDSMSIEDYQFVKRMALSKEKDMLREILEGS